MTTGPGAGGPVVHLCFHGVGVPGRALEAGEAPYWISERLFHAVLDEVGDDPRVRLSFDDGNASDHAVALPALVERGLRATFYVLAGRLDRPGSLGAGAVRELVAADMVVGSHGWEHVPWRGLTPTGVHRELVRAREVVGEASGTPVGLAALPLGRYDRTVLGHLRRLGYAGVGSSDRGWTTEGRWLQPRTSIRVDDTVVTVRDRVLTPPPALRRVSRRATGVLKQWR